MIQANRLFSGAGGPLTTSVALDNSPSLWASASSSLSEGGGGNRKPLQAPWLHLAAAVIFAIISSVEGSTPSVCPTAYICSHAGPRGAVLFFPGPSWTQKPLPALLHPEKQPLGVLLPTSR